MFVLATGVSSSLRCCDAGRESAVRARGGAGAVDGGVLRSRLRAVAGSNWITGCCLGNGGRLVDRAGACAMRVARSASMRVSWACRTCSLTSWEVGTLAMVRMASAKRSSELAKNAVASAGRPCTKRSTLRLMAEAVIMPRTGSWCPESEGPEAVVVPPTSSRIA